MQRVLLFLATNFAILIVLSIAMQVLGIDDMLAASNAGFNTEGILAFSALFGFGGAFLSLAISKFMAKRTMGVRIIEQPSNDTERWIKSTVERFANQSNIGMPEVGIFDQPQPNAFATGMSRNNALVAVSTGLLRRQLEHCFWTCRWQMRWAGADRKYQLRACQYWIGSRSARQYF